MGRKADRKAFKRRLRDNDEAFRRMLAEGQSLSGGRCPHCGLILFAAGTVLTSDRLILGIRHIAEHVARVEMRKVGIDGVVD